VEASHNEGPLGIPVSEGRMRKPGGERKMGNRAWDSTDPNRTKKCFSGRGAWEDVDDLGMRRGNKENRIKGTIWGFESECLRWKGLKKTSEGGGAKAKEVLPAPFLTK